MNDRCIENYKWYPVTFCRPDKEMVTLLFLSVFILLGIVHGVPGEIIRVPEDFEAIQKALDRSQEGDMILVSPGIYQENLFFPGVGVSLCSLDPTSPTLVQQTIIDGSLEEAPAIILSGNEPTTTTLSGFTITGGDYFGMGGGITGQGSKITIENNIIRDNKADFGGGISQCHGAIKNNVIKGNFVYTEGGGVYDCDGDIVGNQILYNSGNQKTNRDAPCFGAGLSRCDGRIIGNEIAENCIFQQYHQFPYLAENIGTGGGGLAYCTGYIADNIIRNNISRGFSVYGGHGGGLYRCSGKIIGNLVEGNSTLYVESGGGGGGAYRLEGVVRNNVFRENSSGTGGGVYYHTGEFVNNIVAFNFSTDIAGGIFYSGCDIRNCIIYGNVAQ